MHRTADEVARRAVDRLRHDLGGRRRPSGPAGVIAAALEQAIARKAQQPFAIDPRTGKRVDLLPLPGPYDPPMRDRQGRPIDPRTGKPPAWWGPRP